MAYYYFAPVYLRPAHIHVVLLFDFIRPFRTDPEIKLYRLGNWKNETLDLKNGIQIEKWDLNIVLVGLKISFSSKSENVFQQMML